MVNTSWRSQLSVARKPVSSIEFRASKASYAVLDLLKNFGLLCGGCALGVKLLQRVHLHIAALQRCNAFAGGTCRRQSCDRRDARSHGRAANCLFVEPGIDAVRRVDNQVQPLALDEVDYVRASFFHLIHALNLKARVLQDLRGAVGCDDAEAEFDKALRDFGNEGLVAIVGTEENATRCWQDLSGCGLRLGKSLSEAVGHAHDFSCGFHLGAKNGVDAGELTPGEDGRFNVVTVAGVEVGAALDVLGEKVAQLASGHEAGGDLGERHAGGLRNIGHGARGPRVDLDHENFVALNGVLDVHKADDLQGARKAEGVVANRGQHLWREVNRRQHARGIAGVDAGLFDVLHDTADDDVLAVGESIDIDFGRRLEEMVDEYRTLLRILDRLFHVVCDRFVVVGDDHGASAEHVRRPNQHGIADAVGISESFFDAGGGRSGGLRDVEFLQQLPEALAVLGEVDAFGRGSDDGHACAFQRQGKIERRLSAELDDDTDGGAACGFVLVDGHHVFVGEWLEVEAVAGVVVGGDGFGIAVDHDGLETIVAQRECGVAAAVVELNSLPDTIGPAAQDDDFLAIGRSGLVFVFVGRIHVRSEALELGGAGVHALVDWANVVPGAQLVHSLQSALALVRMQRLPQPCVGEAHALEVAQSSRADGFQGEAAQLGLFVRDFLKLVQKPRVDVGHLRDLANGHSLRESVADVLQPLRMRRD